VARELLVTKGQLATLWALGLGVVSVFVLLAYVLLRPTPLAVGLQDRTEAVATVVPTGASDAAGVYRLPKTPYTARTLYHQAEQAAREWQSDAAPVSASTSWPFVDLDRFSGPVDWSYSFFSPGTHQLYVVDVHQTRVTPIRRTLVPYALPVLSLDRWQVDSHEALSKWLGSGGADFMRAYPIVDVSARLGVQEGRTVWTIVGADRAGRSAFSIELDASTGDRIE
jgi:hypothetical protein